jgi:hypothetical protein
LAFGDCSTGVVEEAWEADRSAGFSLEGLAMRAEEGCYDFQYSSEISIFYDARVEE